MWNLKSPDALKSVTADIVSAPATPPEQLSRPWRARVDTGPSVCIKGEIAGSEDLTVDGQVDGRIELGQHALTIGPNGRLHAEVFAKSVVVEGRVVGNITASERIDIREHGAVDGDVQAPAVAIADGAEFHGSIDMPKVGVARRAKAS